MWDSFYRYEYEKERERWDPYFRLEKEIQRKYTDSEYRWQKYEEKRMSGQWYNLYLENPMDPILRQRHELLYGRRQDSKQGVIVGHSTVQGSALQFSSISPSPASNEQTHTAHTALQTPSRGSSYSYVPYLSSEELPSLGVVLAEAIVPPAIVWLFTLVTGLGWGSASPLALGLLFMFVSLGFFAALANRTGAILLIYSVPLLLLEPWIIGDPQTVQMARFNALFKAAIILSIIGALYILYWWNRIREEG